MSLSTRSLALTAGILTAAAIFLTGLLAIASPGYGDAFLQLFASVYPGYQNSGGFGDLIVGTLYGLVDGFICGFIFGWLYNRIVPG